MYYMVKLEIRLVDARNYLSAKQSEVRRVCEIAVCCSLFFDAYNVLSTQEWEHMDHRIATSISHI